MNDQYQGEDQEKFHFLFMLSAREASITKSGNNRFFVLNWLDQKALFMTARPGRTRAFIPANQFLTLWKDNNDTFLMHPPRVAIIDSAMNVGTSGIAEAVEIELSNPSRHDEYNTWIFDLKYLVEKKAVGFYNNITLMIDWPAAIKCPEPIRMLVPSLISTQPEPGMLDKTLGTHNEESLHLLCMLWADEAIITHNANSYRLVLKNIDRKMLYSTSRPRKVRGFIDAKNAMSIWIKNMKIFEQEPPEIAIAYTRMNAGKDEIANAIPIYLSKPEQFGEESWAFSLRFRTEVLDTGNYDASVLFIDWLPTLYCPEPISALLPYFFN
ncbi:MAG: hypothetical protein ACREDM_04590 [Methylocella sp.]